MDLRRLLAPFPPAIRARILSQTPASLDLNCIHSHTSYSGRLQLRRNAVLWGQLADDGEALYDHCYGTLKARDVDSGRLASLLNVYGFCRNMSVALALGAIAIALGAGAGTAHTGTVVAAGWWAAGAAVAAGVLFLRYLKIFRLFHEEILTTYAGWSPDLG